MPRSLRDPRPWVPLAVGLVLTASCSSDPGREFQPAEHTTTPNSSIAAGARVGPAFDLRSVMHRTAVAFRAEHGSFAAAGAAFDANVTGSALQVTPRRADAPTPVAHPPLTDGRGSPLSLETSLVARGSHVLADGARPASPVLEHDGALTVRRGEVTERLENDDGGVEQSWRFEHIPSGSGDLVVRVRASGERYAAASEHGLHFEGASGLGLRYGTATWVDANGKRTVVIPRFVAESGEIVMTVPDAVLATSQYPAVLDPTLTPEQEVDKPLAGSSAGGDQNAPSVVSQGPGKGYFAVWYDRRGARPGIYGARVASDGKVLDDTGIPIASSVGSNQPSIAAAPGGAGFLVTWAVSYVDIYQPVGVYGIRLDGNGSLLDAAPVTLATGLSSPQLPKAAFDGTNWFVAWNFNAGGMTSYDIEGVRLPKSGPVLDASPVKISSDTEYEYAPIVSFDGTDFFVSWHTARGVFAGKVGKDGKLVGNRVTLVSIPAASYLYSASETFDGTRHLVTWSAYNALGATGVDIFARRFDVAGTPLDAADLIVAADANYDDQPRVTSDGTNFLIAWSRSGILTGARMNTSGALLDAPITLSTSTSYSYDFSLASDGLGSLLVMSEYSAASGADVKAVKIANPPVAGVPPVILSKAANSETDPSIAWGGTSHYAVLVDSRDPQPDIWGARIDTNAQAQPPVKLFGDPKHAQLSRPRIASDGSGYLVVFSTYDNMLFRPAVEGLRLDATGAPSGGPFELSPVNPNVYEYAEPDVAFDGTNYLVVWSQRSNDGKSISGVRLPKLGAAPLEKDPLRLSPVTPDEQRMSPALAFDGTNYFATWITSRATASNIQVSHVYGTRISKEGIVLDAETVLCDAFLLQRAPRVAADTKRGGFFVAWEDFRTALEAADVYGARISPTGQNLDGTGGMKIATGAHDESRPHVAHAGDDANWVVAWRDLRSKQTYDIYGAWISLAGKNHDPTGYLLSAEAGDEEAPALAGFAPGQLLLAYERLDPRSGYGNYRLRARAVQSGAPVAAACGKNEDCATRACVDTVCCATDCGACGVCNVTPGTCTPRAAGTESPTCPGYKCKGAVECPTKCETDDDCATNTSCDPATKTCVSRVICADAQTLKDLTGKQTSCAPYKCIADACRAQCGSVDDCAAGFVCDYGGRCVQPPTGDASGCAVQRDGTGRTGLLGGLSLFMALAAFAARRRRNGGAGVIRPR